MKNFKRSDFFILYAAFFSLTASITLWFTDSYLEGIFVGLWVPSILSIGSFIKNLNNKK